MTLDFTLLTAEQIFGDDNGNGQLNIMKKYGTHVAPTDLTVLLGGYVSNNVDVRTSENDLTCSSWTISSNEFKNVRVISSDISFSTFASRRVNSARPALPPSETEKLSPTNPKTGVNGVKIVEYGEYPQTVADEKTSEELEKLYQSNFLSPTGKNYTFDSVDSFDDYDTPFNDTSYSEYELEGKKYIRIPAHPCANDSKLSTGERVEKEKPYWVAVQPIEWLVDPTGTWVSKKCLFAGIQFDTQAKYNGNFKDTFMKHYLDTYFAKEMGHDEIVAKREQEKQKHDKVLIGLSAQLEKVSSTDIIKERLKAAEKGRATPTEPKRMDEAARIKQVRQARDIIFKVLQEAKDVGDEKLIREVLNMDVVRIYDGRYRIQQEKFQRRRAARRTQRKQADR